MSADHDLRSRAWRWVVLLAVVFWGGIALLARSCT